jgi:protein arginine N-methyltransferase 3
MGTSYFDEGQIDINEAKEVVTNEFIIKVCTSHLA